MTLTSLLLATLVSAAAPAASDTAPETWFHLIGGNVSKEGLVADLDAIASAGYRGIQFFHGSGDPWPRVEKQMPCLSADWWDFVAFVSRECRRRGLSFKMQNCPGWSMSGGPWVTPDKAMRKLVAFPPDKRPEFDADDDYHEIGEVTFPWNPAPEDGGVSAVTVPNPQQLCHAWAYEPEADYVFYEDDREVFRRACPQGAWQDTAGLTFVLPRRMGVVKDGRRPVLRAEVESRHDGTNRTIEVTWQSEVGLLDEWESKASLGLREFKMSLKTTPYQALSKKTLVFGHVNAKRKNHPAPPEATGWECDKLSSEGFEAVFAGYLGKLLESGVQIDGTLVDSWECGVQNWTWQMEDEFEKIAGYPLRPWLPALFGYILKSEIETEKFLLDWRNVLSRLVEENYYGTIARLAHENGMTVQYETAFGDVLPGDILRFWKYADEPMCEFWSPFDEKGGFVGSHDFKPVLPCVSAAHLYGRTRVSAEAFTSFNLTFDENFREWKENADRHFARGVTHLVTHTYTHNPVVDSPPPSSSFGGPIGSPFLRRQPWWSYMSEFTAYLARCGRELERGRPAVDILMYLGDAVSHKPHERTLLFGNRYKYDYLNRDALFTRLEVREGRFSLPDGMRYRVVWVPAGTFVRPDTVKRLSELAEKGGRVVYGDFTPDWPSPLAEIGRTDVEKWYQRTDGSTNVFFLVEKSGVSSFWRVSGGRLEIYDPVTDCVRHGKDALTFVRGLPSGGSPLVLKPLADYPAWATERIYEGKIEGDAKGAWLDLGDVRDWVRVFVNGRLVRRLWCAPYACDLTDMLQSGTNAIRVEVTSTCYNALIHDAALPESERTTWTICGPTKDDKPRESGLIGPVRIIWKEGMK